jgi:hypothetical protein
VILLFLLDDFTLLKQAIVNKKNNKAIPLTVQVERIDCSCKQYNTPEWKLQGFSSGDFEGEKSEGTPLSPSVDVNRASAQASLRQRSPRGLACQQ